MSDIAPTFVENEAVSQEQAPQDIPQETVADEANPEQLSPAQAQDQPLSEPQVAPQGTVPPKA